MNYYLKLIIIVSFISLLGVSIYFGLRYYNYKRNSQTVMKFKDHNKNKKGLIDEEFNKINKYYINLDKDNERRENLERQIEEFEIKNIFRISAMNPSKLDKLDYIKREKTTVLSCLLSHINAITQAYKDNQDYAIIMEDDIDLSIIKSWKYNFSDIIEKLPKDLEILNLCSQKRNETTNGIKFISSIKELKSGAVCYLINKKGMRKVMDLIYDQEERYILDINKKKYEYIADVFLYRNLNSYILVPKLFLLNDSENESSAQGNGKSTNDLVKYSKLNTEIINKYYNHINY